MAYGEKIFGLSSALAAITDNRKKPRIPTDSVVRSALVMFATRLGSLNSLEQVEKSPFLRDWIGGPLPSADSIGRICARIDPDTVRRAIHQLYADLKRAKALTAPWHGLLALVVDGHESHATYRRCCDGCLTRKIKTAQGERIQYYHRDVSAMLVAGELELFLDTEPQHAGEDEIAAAIRLLTRVLAQYPRSFDVVLADALYTDPRFYNFLLDRDQAVLTVLKGNTPALLEDAKSLLGQAQREVVSDGGKKQIEAWDMEGFTSWPQTRKAVRVVRSQETSEICRQIDGETETVNSEWFWVTTLGSSEASTKAVVELGHNRWIIENRGFNEATNQWHADHVYRHEPTAMLVFNLLCMLTSNLFRAFFLRNLKPACRKGVTMIHIARTMLQELMAGLCEPASAPP